MKRTPHTWFDPHMVRSAKALLWNAFTTFGVFLTLLVLFRLAGTIYASQISIRATEAFQTGLAQELAYLKEQGDAVANNDVLQTYLLAKDYTSLLDLLQQERDVRSIGLMGVTNESGAIVSRTKTVAKSGDNVFLTAPAGRIVAKGESVESVELTGFNGQLFLTTGRPIMSEGTMIGGLFANYLTDHDFAIRFRDGYFPDGVELAFYSKQYGIYGNSFSDPEIHQLTDAYFNTGSEWIKNGMTGKTVYLQDGRYFLVENVIFPGLEESPGGVLIFIPRQDISVVANLIIGLVTVFTFCILALHDHLRSRREEKGWRYYLLLAMMACLVVGSIYFILRIQDTGFLKLKDLPYALGTDTIGLNPEFGIFDTDVEQRFSIVAEIGADHISQVNVGLLFNPDAIEVTTLDTTHSQCSRVVTNTIDTQSGRADFSCALPQSQADVGSVVIAEVVVQAHNSGTATIEFDQAVTQLIAADDLSLNHLRMAQSGSYRFENFHYADDASAEPSSSVDPLVVFSPTHPNLSRWYSTQTARFVWIDHPGVAYHYAFDNKPDTVPLATNLMAGSTIELPVPGDGTYYFHLQRVGENAIAHYRIQSDRSPPTILSMAVSSQRVMVGDVLRLDFKAEDAGSGVQRNYFVAMRDDLFLPVGTQILIPMSEAGHQSITFRVYDDAGNYSEQSTAVDVVAK